MDDRRAISMSVGELAEIVHGTILNSPEKSGEIIENLMVGAMCIDPAPLYFNQKTMKAVITRGDRADIQLGALETPTQCLVLTGGTGPLPSILQHAQEKQVPIIVSEQNTEDVLSEIEMGLARSRS